MYLKMVKIRVTGTRRYEWIDAKYDTNYSAECGDQSSFTLECFKGTSVPQSKYNVELIAMVQRGVRGKYVFCF